jgi:hypothetical protein
LRGWHGRYDITIGGGGGVDVYWGR